MAFPQGIDFRTTSGFVTDPTGCDFVNELSTYNYPHVTAQGNTVGWTTSPGSGSGNSRDRTTAGDHRLAGMFWNSSAADTFQIDLPSAGTYTINLAMGDTAYARTVKCEVFDTTTSLAVLCNGSTGAAGKYLDATGVSRTAAAWPGSNAASSQTFSTTACRFKFGTVAGNDSFVAHVNVAASGGSTAALSAKCMARAAGNAGATGAVALLATATVRSFLRTAVQGIVGLSAKAVSGSYATNAPTVRAALAALARASTAARATTIGTVGMAARAMTAVTVRGLPSLVATLVAVASRASIAVTAKGAMSGTLGLSARAMTAATARGLPALVAALVGLAARGGITVSAKGAISGTVGLAGRAAAALTARGVPALVTALVALASRGAIAVSAKGVVTGRVGLAARAATAASIKAGAGAAAGLVARVSVTAAARSTAAFALALSGTTRLALKGRAGAAGALRLVAGAAVAVALRGLAFAGGLIILRPNYLAALQPRRRTSLLPRRIRTAIKVNNVMAQTNDLSPAIEPDEQETVTFDFGKVMKSGVTIASVSSVSCSVYLGTDAGAASRLLGSSTITASPQSGAANAAVLQLVGAMIDGVTYRLECVVITSDGQKLSAVTHLSCAASV